MYYGNRVYNSFNVEKRTDSDIPSRLDAILGDAETLDGDKQFMTSLKQYWDKNKYLTVRQFEAIGRIESKKGERKENDEFRNNFTDDQRETLQIVAKYYHNLGSYYKELAFRVVSDPNFIPSKKQYESMCCNKYSEALVENYKIPPKFHDGEIVCVRDTYRYNFVTPGQVLMVVSGTDIVGPAKGSRVYRVMRMGELATIDLEEKDIKKYRKY